MTESHISFCYKYTNFMGIPEIIFGVFWNLYWLLLQGRCVAEHIPIADRLIHATLYMFKSSGSWMHSRYHCWLAHILLMPFFKYTDSTYSVHMYMKCILFTLHSTLVVVLMKQKLLLVVFYLPGVEETHFTFIQPSGTFQLISGQVHFFLSKVIKMHRFVVESCLLLDVSRVICHKPEESCILHIGQMALPEFPATANTMVQGVGLYMGQTMEHAQTYGGLVFLQRFGKDHPFFSM